jgi:hypothetical protein
LPAIFTLRRTVVFPEIITFIPAKPAAQMKRRHVAQVLSQEGAIWEKAHIPAVQELLRKLLAVMCGFAVLEVRRTL